MKQTSFFSCIKKRFFDITILLVLILLTLSIQSHFSFPVSHNRSKSADKAFEQFTSSLFREEVSSSTLNLHFTLQNPEKYGIRTSSISLGAFPQDAVLAKASIENCQAMLKKFSSTPLSPKNQLTYEILEDYLQTARNGTEFYLYDEPLNPTTGIQAQLPVLLAEYQFHSTKDIDTYLKLLKTTPDYFQSLIQFEQEKEKLGLLLPGEILLAIKEQCQSLLNMGDQNYLYSSFEERLASMHTVSRDQKASYIVKNKEAVENYVLPAYQSLLSALERFASQNQEPLAGVCRLPNGKKYYEYLVAKNTGSSRTISELKALLHSQMAEDASCLKTCIETSAIKNKSIPNRPKAFLNMLKSQIKHSFPQPARVKTNIKYVPKSMEPYLSPAFYLIPCVDNITQNTIYINPAHNIDDLKLFTTLAHEGYPGHLYQTTYFAQQNPDPVRCLLNFGGYTEGWATYVEMCSYYLAPITKKEAVLAQKNCSLLLGMYACADIGIHYDGWTLPDTIHFFSQYGITDKHAVEDIYQLIISDPGNYLKYYVGYVEFLELKKEVSAQLGEAFSQKAFHKAVLDIGPAPFSILHKHIFHYL